MRLLGLSANQPTFRPVTFRREGLSLVVADQKTERSARTLTYNGVGKSLMFELLHFCLGANKNEALAEALPNWSFTLALEAGGGDHTIERSSDSSRLLLDGEQTSLKDLRDFLERAAFAEKPPVGSISARNVLSRFIRSGRAAYHEFSYVHEGDLKKPYVPMLVTAFLLGLDTILAKRKYELRERQLRLVETMKQVERDPVFKPLLTEDTVDLELLSLKEQAGKLERDLTSFRVAEDYHAIELEANEIKRQLDRHRRQTVKLRDALQQIERSLRSYADLSPEMVFGMYQEAEAVLPELVQKRIEEVVGFHRELSRKRALRLSRDRQRLADQLSGEEEEVKSGSVALDEKVRYLSEHRALDEYLAVTNELAEVRKSLARLEESKRIREAADRELKRIKLEFAKENIATDSYLESVQSLVTEASSIFRSFAQELYGAQRLSGLKIANDDGENQLRYRLDAHIAGDAAEGINEAKIFCFDMTLLSLQRGHRMRCVGHDSTLFGPIDPRQRLAMFIIADRLCRERGFQYIAALNKHDLSTMEDLILEGQVVAPNFAEAVVLKLTDGSPAEKLLGIEIDMNYMKGAAVGVG